MRALHALFPSAAVKDHSQTAAGLLDPYNLHVFADIQTVRVQLLADNGDQLRVIFGHDRKQLKHRDLGTQVAMCLGKLDPDRAAADDDQVVWQRVRIEDSFVGIKRHFVQARDRRHEGR